MATNFQLRKNNENILRSEENFIVCNTYDIKRLDILLSNTEFYSILLDTVHVPCLKSMFINQSVCKKKEFELTQWTTSNDRDDMARCRRKNKAQKYCNRRIFY